MTRLDLTGAGPRADEPLTLSIRYGDRSLEVRARTAVLLTLLSMVGGGAAVLRNASAAPADKPGDVRIGALESRATAIEGEMKDVKSEVRQMRIDQIEQWKWEARRTDPARVQYLDQRRRALGPQEDP